jgi:hypothetical protein
LLLLFRSFILAQIFIAGIALCRLPGSRTMDDFEALLAIVAAGGLGPAADDEFAADPQLEMLVALAAAVPAERRKHEQRSWQATEKARDAKRQRKTEKQLATALEGKRKAEDLLQAVGSLVPHVARSLGVTIEGREMTATRAEHWALVATKPTCRGDDCYHLPERRAVWLMAETLETLQTRFTTGVLGGPLGKDSWAGDRCFLEEGFWRALGFHRFRCFVDLGRSLLFFCLLQGRAVSF